jgi:mannose-1-phosphate guanylyltransferase/mannose-1-phosphate guanylyltransferase/mannose-6-phosphate isomerase
VSKPKPFLPLVEEQTLFEQAILRCTDAHFHAPLVVTGAGHVEHVEAQLGIAPDAEIIVEPLSKNTAAAIALAALRLPDDSVMLVCPSDHHIGDYDAFRSAARAAADLAAEGWLVSFGIEPRSPDTGFGYLRRGERIGKNGFKVAQFVEKPDLARAEAYLACGEYAWNGGIFAFGVGAYLEELRRFRPELFAAVSRSVEKGQVCGRRFYPDADAFRRVEPESVDYAVMENTIHAAMVPAEMAWSDIGNWQALHGARKRDQSGNSIRGPVELVDCRNVLVESDGARVSVIGTQNLIIVVDGGDILVTSADSAHKVGKLSGAVNQ